LKILKKYELVISAFGVALAIYMGVYDITDKHTAYLLGSSMQTGALVSSRKNTSRNCNLELCFRASGKY
jgi:hypothetical protein